MFGCRPSGLVGIRNTLLAFMFDDAVATFGLRIDGLAAEKRRDGKPRHKLEKLLREDDEIEEKRLVTEGDIMKMSMWGVPVEYVKSGG